MKLNRWTLWLARVFKQIRFDVDKALRRQYQDGYNNGYAQGQKEPAECTVCPLYQRTQRSYMAAYEPPSPNTDPALLARLEAQKKRDEMKAFLNLEDSRELPTVSGKLGILYKTRKLREL